MNRQMKYFVAIGLALVVVTGLVIARESIPVWKGQFQPPGELDVKSMSTEELSRLGKEVFAEAPCLSCHSLAGKGAEGPGPDLSGVGARYDEQWIEEFITNPAQVRPGAGMPAAEILGLDQARIKAVAAFLATQTEGGIPAVDGSEPGSGGTSGGGEFDDSVFPEFMKTTCSACHSLENIARYQSNPKGKTWRQILDLMVMYGAEFGSEEAAQVLEYLEANWPLQ